MRRHLEDLSQNDMFEPELKMINDLVFIHIFGDDITKCRSFCRFFLMNDIVSGNMTFKKMASCIGPLV